LRWIAAAIALLAITLLVASRGPSVEDARAFYASLPPFQRPFPYTPVPTGVPDLRAESCGICHREIYEEWRVSTHARAWLDDAQFQAELDKSRTGSDVGWMCINCHTPLENQLDRLVVGLEQGRVERPRYIDNPNFDPALQLDAITCAVCHVRDGVILGPFGDTSAPHPVRRAPELLTPEVCNRCHQAKAHFREISLACVFDTGEEFARGPYAAEGKVCQSCHMPEVERSLTNLGTPPRKTRRHWFGGSLIPKHPRFAAELEPLAAHYPDGLASRWLGLPESVRAGEPVTLRFEAHNAQAGHLLPTGDPERYILLRAEVTGPAGERLAADEVRFGTTYQWSPEVKKLGDTRLAPRERRSYAISFTAPASGILQLRLSASKWRISPENLRYHHLEDKYVAGRPFLDQTRELPVATLKP